MGYLEGKKKCVCVWEPEQSSQELYNNMSQHIHGIAFSERKKERGKRHV